MPKKLDQIIVVDVEATCWDTSPPPGETNEIIEIGLCPLDVATLQRLPRRSLLVRPVRSGVSPFCTQLTTLTPEQVATGMTFMEACEILRREYLTRDRVWASFGDYDRTQFQKQCDATGVPYPFGPRHLNVKTLFALCHGLTSSEVGMSEVVKHANITFEGTHHRGHDDAWNIAGILAQLLGKWRTPSV
jgi:inhibitor of KinA sporulation pathway (predicted exonuclease)